MIDDGTCLFARFNWNRTAVPWVPRLPFVTFKDIHLSPSDEFPTGRKGMMLSRYWQQQQQGCDRVGIILLDGDVVADPGDIRALIRSVVEEPGSVHTAPVKLWYSGEWFWSHQGEEMRLTKDCLTNPYYFSFGLTFLPARLLRAAIKAGLDGWFYPYVDERMSQVAAKENIPVRVVLNSMPKHVHW
jgi:hypothetical protein